MANTLITGSADGLGQLAAKALVAQGHQVVLHARNAERAQHAAQQAPGAAHVIAGDVSDIDETKNAAYLIQKPQLSFSDSKLHVLMLCMVVARRWPDVYANAVDPGWVPTKMGGRGAPDDLQKGYETQTWLAVSDDPRAKVSGRYFHHRAERPYSPQANDVLLQERFLSLCRAITGIAFPQ